MELIPAIDLRAGRVVRLTQGAFERSTEYGRDPIAVARRWVREGARRLHIVDLDGAREGTPVQRSLVAAVIQAAGVPCQVGGGIRTEDAATVMLGLGADRIVLGTALLTEPEIARRIIARHGPDALLAALDVRTGQAVGAGWAPGAAGIPAGNALTRLADASVRRFVVTAIDRDGTLGGPDLHLLRGVLGRDGTEVIASGGIASIDDLVAVRDLGCAGAILGRSLYEGRIDLAQALDAVSNLSG